MKKVFSLATVVIAVFALSACRGPWGWHGGHGEYSVKGKYDIHNGKGKYHHNHNGKGKHHGHNDKSNHGSKGRMKIKKGHNEH